MSQGKPITKYQKKRMNELHDQDLTHQEIADYLNISQPSVTKWLRRAKKEVLHGEK
jgi:predicted DNA-binding protein YlxM (UPF0122 family)